jgi:hypothetical protein
LGWPDNDRNGHYILEQINQSIDAINQADLGYNIQDRFEWSQCMTDQPRDGRVVGRNIIHERFNDLHRYFEDLQGTSGNLSLYYQCADAVTRWHIRQLNLLCHEFECWALSYRRQLEAPEWIRPSTLMCWLSAPRFLLDDRDFELFGIDAINRDPGGVYVGVNKAVGKHHWEVFNDEGGDSRLDSLTTGSLRSQTEAAGDFDIEWGRCARDYPWQKERLQQFETWLHCNGFDPRDPGLTIGHPKVAQVDLDLSFGTTDTQSIWKQLSCCLDVWKVSVAGVEATYDYHWSDCDFTQRQIEIIKRREQC